MQCRSCKGFQTVWWTTLTSPAGLRRFARPTPQVGSLITIYIKTGQILTHKYFERVFPKGQCTVEKVTSRHGSRSRLPPMLHCNTHKYCLPWVQSLAQICAAAACALLWGWSPTHSLSERKENGSLKNKSPAAYLRFFIQGAMNHFLPFPHHPTVCAHVFNSSQFKFSLLLSRLFNFIHLLQYS